MHRPIVARPVALLIATALVLAACGSNQTSPAPSPSATPASTPTSTRGASPSTNVTPLPSGVANAIYDEIQAQVDAIRGLEPTTVKRETLDAEALKKFNAAGFAEDNPPEYVAANERLYKALGLLPEGDTLEGLFLDLIDSQVAGFYRPDAKTLYVVSRSGTINGADKITFAHEYDHALQDANFPVFGEQKELLDETDRALARAAIYEGDATLLMSFWAQTNLTPEEFGEVLQAGQDPASVAVLERTPAILVDSLLFPYNAGVAFVAPRQATGGWAAVDAFYSRLPLSTEQILHPEKFDDGEKPISVALPAELAADIGAGWSVALQDTFGEFQMGTWFREAGVGNGATQAAAGWGGDRLAVLNGPDGAWAVVMRTAWDSEADAAEFETAAKKAIPTAGGAAAVLPGEGGTTRWFIVGNDAAALETVARALGLAG